MRNKVVSFALLVSAAACGTAETKSTTPATEAASIDTYIASLPYLPVDPESEIMGAVSPAMPSGDYSCTTQNLTETKQFDQIVAYAANSDSMWPGAIISADSVLTGLFTQIVAPRAPATISVSLQNIAGSQQATIAEPSLAGYRTALAGILNNTITGSTAANISSDVEQVHSENDLDMALGVQASWGLGIASLKTSFDFSDQKIMSRYIVRYTQAYYTVDLDAPQSPSAVFAPTETLSDIKGKMDDDHPPAYVSSVTYGRMIVFTFESTYSAEEMSAALDFTYSGGADVSGDVSVSYKDIISNSKITAFILGGDGGAAAQAIDSYDALMAFIQAGGNYSLQSPGAPIGYKLSYLKDNSPARMSMTTDYDVQSCTRVSQQVQVSLDEIAVDVANESGNDIDLYGTVTASGAPGTPSQTMFSKTDSDYVQIKQGQAFGTPGTALSTQIISVSPQPGQSLSLNANLSADRFFGDTSLGNETVTIPYETGWNKTVTINLTGDGSQVRVVMEIAPI